MKQTTKANVPAKTMSEKTGAVNALVISDDMQNLPAWMQGDIGAGKDNIGTDDVEIPRLKLIQGTSPELDEYDDLRKGDFFHTSMEKVLKGPVRIVPIFMDRRYILWRPRGEGGGILARADDGIHWSPADRTFEVKLDAKDGGHKVTWRTAKTVADSGLAEWGTFNPSDPDSAPAATLMYNYVVAFPDYPELGPAVLTFQRSTLRVGKRFNTKLKTTRAPMFGLVFELTSTKETGADGDDFQGMSIIGSGRINDEKQYLQYKALHGDFAQTGVQIKDLESVQNDVVESEGAGEPEAVDERVERTVNGQTKTRPRM